MQKPLGSYCWKKEHRLRSKSGGEAQYRYGLILQTNMVLCHKKTQSIRINIYTIFMLCVVEQVKCKKMMWWSLLVVRWWRWWWWRSWSDVVVKWMPRLKKTQRRWSNRYVHGLKCVKKCTYVYPPNLLHTLLSLCIR